MLNGLKQPPKNMLPIPLALEDPNLSQWNENNKF
jgi:hypothetical protein